MYWKTDSPNRAGKAGKDQPAVSVADQPRLAMMPCAPLMAAAVFLWLLTGFAPAKAALPAASGVDAGAAISLRARRVALQEQLAANPFKRPLVLESFESSRDVKGDIYAVVPYPFIKMSDSLSGPQAWCDILILHLNTKSCQIAQQQGNTSLLMNVGKKFDQPIQDSFLLTFAWQLRDHRSDYLRVLLSADEGPLSTRDYRITLEAVPMEDGATFMHLSYAYGFGLSGKIAMLAYFNTIGRLKVGFTEVGREEAGKPVYVGGMRGLVERNTMRYYLAIESYLGALNLPPASQFEKRINDWFAAIERYPRQLHEMEQREYLEMKRHENQRQQGKL